MAALHQWISDKAPREALVQRLLAPDSQVLGQGVRFVLVGGLVALIYLLTTTLLALVAGVPFEIALTTGFLLAIAVHFTLQRVFVWTNHNGFALPLHRQAGRYLSISGAQYGVTSASTALLPGVLGLHTEVVYVATVMLLAATNFIVFRHGVFHAKPQDRAS
jgi:putative flippase GtrA